MDRNAVIAQILPDYRGWLLRVAYAIGGPSMQDDLAQEGAIAMWRAVGTYDPTRGPAMVDYLQWKARMRMKQVVTGHNFVGSQDGDEGGTRVGHSTSRGVEVRARMRGYLREHPGATSREMNQALGLGLSAAALSYHRKRLYDDVEPPPPPTSLDVLLDAGFDPAGAADVLDDVTGAYFEGRIAEALDALTPNERRYVLLRFWHGLEKGELRAAFGYEPTGAWTTAKARLKPLLGELVSA